MPPPGDSAKTGGRLSGKDVCNYMETFAETFLKDKIKFEVEVLNIRRSPSGSWNVDIKDKYEGTISVLEYSRIVLCTGVSTQFENGTISELRVYTGLPFSQCPESLVTLGCSSCWIPGPCRPFEGLCTKPG
jgi:hypothetical protein